MRLEYLLARRTSATDRASRSSVMTRIALFAVALGIAVMIVTLAVIDGFRDQIHSTLRGFGADITLMHYAGIGEAEAQPLEYDSALVAQVRRMPEVQSIAEYISVGAMAKNGDNVAGLLLKGISPHYPTKWWRSRIVSGNLPNVQSPERHKEIMLSQATASQLGLTVGDKVEMLFMEEERPRRDRFKVAGIYATGMEEIDQSFALADIRDLRRVVAWETEQVTGYDVVVREPEQTTEVKEKIQSLCEESENLSTACILARSLEEREPVTFDWLKAHNINARVVIVILLCVLLFNMASAMLIMVLDRHATIGLLKAQGMRNGAIRLIFLIRAMMLFVRGALWGNLIGLTLVAIQAWWRVIELDAQGYMLNFLPVKVELWWVVALNGGVFVITLLMMILPSYLISRISPEQSLRYRQ